MEFLLDFLRDLKKNPKIKRFLKNMFWTIAVFFIFLIVIKDTHASDGGYLKYVFTYCFFFLESGRLHAVEIADTPLASLTLAKLGVFIFYVFIAISLWRCFCFFIRLLEEKL